MEQHVGLVLVLSSAADLAAAVARVDQLLGAAVEKADDPDSNPASEKDEEQEDAEDVRAGPALVDIVHLIVLAHNYEPLDITDILSSQNQCIH